MLAYSMKIFIVFVRNNCQKWSWHISGCIVCELRGSNARSGVAALAISDERTGSIRHLELKEASVYFEIIKGQL